MKYYSYYVKVDLKDTKKLLELSEEDFYKYGDFAKELNLLMDDNHSYNALLSAYDVISGKKTGIVFMQKKAYRDFISKYSSFLEHFGREIGIYSCWTRDRTYEILKENYENKDGILDRINKLLELGINYFYYIPNEDLNDDKLEKKDEYYETIDIMTDGKVSYGPETLKKFYPVNVEGAKYIIECKKYQFSGDYTHVSIEMVVNDLMFDLITLPTYKELHDFDIKPYIDYEEVERSTELRKQKNELANHILYVDDTLEIAEDLMSRLEHLAKGFNDIPGEISKEKMQVIKELCAEVEMLKDAVVADSVSKELMTEEEIKAEVKVKKRDRYFSGSHCCCC